MSLSSRSARSISSNLLAKIISGVIQLITFVLLARWLPVESFGVYAFALALVSVSVTLIDFGMSGAFLHYANDEGIGEDRASVVHFGFRIFFLILWFLLFFPAVFFFAKGALRTTFFVLIGVTIFSQLVSTPGVILLKRVKTERIALLQVISALLSLPISLYLGWHALAVWALLANNIVSALVDLFGFYVFNPVWLPHFKEDRQLFKKFFDFGKRNLLGAILYEALDRVDDLWAGTFLGAVSLGLYSRSYELATYPRKILANPINWVLGSIYAELKDDRAHLSEVFQRSLFIMVRISILLGGVLFLIAPEMISLLLGEKWTALIPLFRLMLIFTILDPLKIMVSSLIGLAGGKPEYVAHARLWQFAVLLAGLFSLGFLWGNAGVALAVDLMLVVGLLILFYRAREFADFSVRQIFLVPAIGLLGGLLLAFLSASFLQGFPYVIVVETGLFLLIYIMPLFLLEGQLLKKSFQMPWRQ